MNFLADVYQDGYYRQYLDTNPLLAVCVVGDEGAQQLEQSLLQAEGAEFQVCVSCAKSFASFRPKKAKSPLVEHSKGLLKAEWCYKHQYQRFSSIILVSSWETYTKSGLPQKLLQLIDEAKVYLSHSNCRLIVAFLSETDTRSVEEGKVAEASAALNKITGDNYGNTVVVGRGGAGVDSSARLRRAVVDAGLQYHAAEIKRLHDAKNELVTAGKETSAVGAVVRNHFKTGWHHLVMRDYRDARKHMDKAYKIIRLFSPKFAPMEARVCASLILHFSVTLAPFCGEDFSPKSKIVAAIQDHIEWLGHAFTAEYSPNCRSLLRTLRAFLMMDWYIFLATTPKNTSASVRRDYYFSAANCLEEILADLPGKTTEKLEIPAPPFVGTECANDAYANVILSSLCPKNVAEKIFQLLDEGCAVTGASGVRDLERRYLEISTRRALEEFDEAQLTGEFYGSLLMKNWKSSFVTSFLAQTVLSSKLPTNSASHLRAAIHSLASDEVDISKKCVIVDQLSCHGDGSTSDNILVEYPAGASAPPLTVCTSFDDFVCESVTEEAVLQVTLFPTLPVRVSIENVKLELRDLQAPADNAGFTVASHSPPQEISPGPSHPGVVLREKITFPCNGLFYCSAIQGELSVLEKKLTVRIELSSEAWRYSHGAKVTTSDGANFRPQVIQVTRPLSFVTLDFEHGETIEVVEGQQISANFSVKTLKDRLTDCHLRIPTQTKLFSCELRDATTNAPLKPSRPGPTDPQTTKWRTFPIAAETWQQQGEMGFVFYGRGLKNGVYLVPVVLDYSTTRLRNLEVVKYLRVYVDPPFAVRHTFFGTTAWTSHSGVVDVPAVTTMNSRVEKNVLIKSKASSSSGTHDADVGNLSLYYATVDEANCSPDARDFSLAYGEPATVHTELTCTSRSALVIRKIDVVCVDGVEVLYTSVGELPCVVEEGEIASLVAKIRVATKTGKFNPGFIRILFSPHAAPTENLVADLPLPAVQMEEASLSWQLDCPQTATVGVTFPVTAVFTNHTMVPFSGEFSLDTRNENFVVSGRSRWKIDLGPQDSSTVIISLVPIRCGHTELAALQLRDNASGNIVLGRTKNTHFITVVPLL